MRGAALQKPVLLVDTLIAMVFQQLQAGTIGWALHCHRYPLEDAITCRIAFGVGKLEIPKCFGVPPHMESRIDALFLEAWFVVVNHPKSIIVHQLTIPKY